MERAAINRSAKLGGSSSSSSSKLSAMKSAEKPKPIRPRNALKELNCSHLRSSQPRESSRSGCFGGLLSNPSSSSTAVSCGKNALRNSKNPPRTPTSAPPISKSIRPAVSRKNPARPSFAFLKRSVGDLDRRKVPESVLSRRGKSDKLFVLGREISAEISLFKHGTGPKDRSNSKSREGREEDRISNSKTPTSGRTATPPVQPTISPEFSTLSTLPTPACFAAGHLLTGVQDRRKCRPRGILNGGLNSIDSITLGSQASFTPPPPVEASVKWHSSPSSKKVFPRCSTSGCVAEASSIIEKNSTDKSPSDRHLLNTSPEASSINGFFSPKKKNSEKSPSDHHLQYTSPVLEIYRSPDSGSGLSPFSMILQKASGVQRLKNCDPETSVNSWGDCNVMVTPSSCSSSGRMIMEEEASGGFSCTPLPDQSLFPRSILSESFGFGCSPISLGSVDLSRFQRPSHLQISPRISWRDGLISRIWSLEEGEMSKTLEGCSENSDFEMVEDQASAQGFGSFELWRKKGEDIREHYIMSPDDSEWTLFFKNHLFEVEHRSDLLRLDPMSKGGGAGRSCLTSVPSPLLFASVLVWILFSLGSLWRCSK
ncbi:GPI-anchored adhesin-like protein [Wolffia australiana]